MASYNTLLWKEASDSGLFGNGGGALFELNSNLYGNIGGYAFAGPGIELIGGSFPQLAFSNAKLQGEYGNTLEGLKMSGKYNLTPTPIYVEKP
jgi:hypothetical protein